MLNFSVIFPLPEKKGQASLLPVFFALQQFANFLGKCNVVKEFGGQVTQLRMAPASAGRTRDVPCSKNGKGADKLENAIEEHG
ncbi:hypothetical protein [Pannonibacter indicus]|uniref:hypothetical protein n=1 Tax=Pannonibacter indicus TaxID=466044 RepID=UPI0039195362